MKKLFLITSIVFSLVTNAQTLNYISSNYFNQYVDTRITKAVAPLINGQLVSVGILLGNTNYDYTTITGNSGIAVTNNSGTNIVISFTGSVPGTVISSTPSTLDAVTIYTDTTGTNLGPSKLTVISTNASLPGILSLNSLSVTSTVTAATVNTTALAVNGNAIIYGTYVPNIVNITNAAAITAHTCQYMRVGTVVTISGLVTIDPVNNDQTLVSISLPIASNFTQVYQCAGTGMAIINKPSEGCAIYGDVTNDYAILNWNTTQVASQDIPFTFTYLIL